MTVPLIAKTSSGYRDVSLDLTTRSLQTMDYAHHEIHAGDHYSVTYGVADIGAAITPADAITLTFTTPNTTKWCHMIVAFNGVGGARCIFREGGTGGVSASGTITCKNSNRNSSSTSGILDIEAVPTVGQMSCDAGIDTGGTLLIDEYISGASTNQNKAGTTSAERNEWILKQNTRYQVVLLSSATVSASIVLSWYEHTDTD